MTQHFPPTSIKPDSADPVPHDGSLRQQLEHILLVIRDARLAVSTGHQINATKIMLDVDELCRSAQMLTGKSALSFAARMDDLVTALDMLSNDLLQQSKTDQF